MKNMSHFPGNSMMLITAIFMMILFTLQGYSQGVAISESGAAPDPSAMLDVQSTEKGMLVPRMTLAERNAIVSPQTGLLIYQTDVAPGFYYNAGAPAIPDWQPVSSQGSQWISSGSNLYYNSGNVGIGQSNPQYQLHVNNRIKAEGGIFGNAPGLVGVGFDFYGGETGLFDMEVDKLIAGKTSSGQAYQYGGTPYTNEGMFINNGFVGIGTGSPGARLDVTEDALISGLTVGKGGGASELNIALGNQALFNNTSGNHNTAVGNFTLHHNVHRSRSTAIGSHAMRYAHNLTGISYNTAIGFEALRGQEDPSVNTGVRNTAAGDQALRSNSAGSFNIGIGTGALYANTEGSYNTASGSYALHSNITGNNNTGVGASTLYYNQSGYNNTATGVSAMNSNTSGYWNTASGAFALNQNLTGNANTGIGHNALFYNQTGSNNIALGANALFNNTERSNLVAIGDSALYHNGLNASQPLHGAQNTAIGSKSLTMNKEGYSNTATGFESMRYNEDGYSNTAYGIQSLALNSSGNSNTAIGSGALVSNTNGYLNTALGFQSGINMSGVSLTGNKNTFLGVNTYYLADISNSTAVGADVMLTTSNTVILGTGANVGIGTSEPSRKLDVVGQVRIRGGSPGTGKVLTSDADGVGTWQTPSWSNWTVSGSNIYRASGNVGIGASNPAFHLSIGDNGVGISRPATNTLSFHTASSERMRISSTGNVGIGSSAPGELLHVRNTSGTAKIRVQSTNVSAIDFYNNTAYVAGIGVSVSEGHLFLYNGGNVSVKGGNLGIGNTNPGQKLDITAGNGRVESGYAWLTNSDIRYKKNVSTLENVLAKVSNLRGVRYDLMADDEITPGHGKHIGFIAQELETEFPEFVVTGEDGYKSVAYDKMTAVLLQAVKEQQATIESHKEVIELLKQRIENLEEER